MANRLTDIEVHEVSLVDAAANGRRFAVVKRKIQKNASGAAPDGTAAPGGEQPAGGGGGAAAEKEAPPQVVAAAGALDALVKSLEAMAGLDGQDLEAAIKAFGQSLRKHADVFDPPAAAASTEAKADDAAGAGGEANPEQSAWAPSGDQGAATQPEAKALEGISTQLASLTELVKSQAARIAAFEKQAGLPQSGQPDGGRDGTEKAFSWPLDLNATNRAGA